MKLNDSDKDVYMRSRAWIAALADTGNPMSTSQLIELHHKVIEDFVRVFRRASMLEPRVIKEYHALRAELAADNQLHSARPTRLRSRPHLATPHVCYIMMIRILCVETIISTSLAAAFNTTADATTRAAFQKVAEENTLSDDTPPHPTADPEKKPRMPSIGWVIAKEPRVIEMALKMHIRRSGLGGVRVVPTQQQQPAAQEEEAAAAARPSSRCLPEASSLRNSESPLQKVQ
jgi:hypothetical protein